MIAFVTLLLGLISGVYPIEVAVGGPVAGSSARHGLPASIWGWTSVRTSSSPAPSTPRGARSPAPPSGSTCRGRRPR